MEITELEPDKIEIPKWAREIDRDYLKESVSSRGIINPVVVARLKSDKGERYILVDGRGRLEVAKSNNMEKIPCRVIDVKSEDDAIFLAIELEQSKEDWSLEYLTSVVLELLNKGYSKKEIAEKLKIPSSKLYRILNIIKFEPKIRDMFYRGLLPLRFADDLAKVKKMKPEVITEVLEDPYDHIIKRSDEEIAARLKVRVRRELEEENYRKKVREMLKEILQKTEIPDDIREHLKIYEDPTSPIMEFDVTYRDIPVEKIIPSSILERAKDDLIDGIEIAVEKAQQIKTILEWLEDVPKEYLEKIQIEDYGCVKTIKEHLYIICPSDIPKTTKEEFLSRLEEFIKQIEEKEEENKKKIAKGWEKYGEKITSILNKLRELRDELSKIRIGGEAGKKLGTSKLYLKRTVEALEAAVELCKTVEEEDSLNTDPS